MQELQKIEDALDPIAKIKIADYSDFGRYLYFSHKLEKLAKRIKERVKIQGSQLMSDKNDTKIEFDNFYISKTDGAESDDYDPKTVYEIFYPKLGDNVWTLLQVRNTKIKELLPSQIQYGFVTAEESEKLNKSVTVKRRKGSVQLREKTDKNKLLV